VRRFGGAVGAVGTAGYESGYRQRYFAEVGVMVRRNSAPGDSAKLHGLPALLTSGEVAELLRTTRKAVYAMVERRQLPGVIRVGRRVLFQQQALVDWLGQKSSPSLER
jgi:excisionase family DNA binding protein